MPLRVFKKWIDRRAISVATRLMPSVDLAVPPQPEALDLLNDPRLLSPPAQPPELSFTSEHAFQFHSLAPTGSPFNDRVHGKYFRAGSGRPTVIIVHGWNAELHYLHGCPRLARSLNERGLNALLFELPYHLQRRPTEPGTMRDFISPNLTGMLRATRQAIADIEALALWARRENRVGTAVWGFSLGAWLAGLHATQSDTAHAVLLTTPVSDLKRAVETLPFCFPIRAALQNTAAPVERLNLTRHRPRPRPEKILVMESLYDQFVPADTYPGLAQAWQLPAWQKVPQSHISVLTSRRSMKLAMDWLATQLRPTTS